MTPPDLAAAARAAFEAWARSCYCSLKPMSWNRDYYGDPATGAAWAAWKAASALSAPAHAPAAATPPPDEATIDLFADIGSSLADLPGAVTDDEGLVAFHGTHLTAVLGAVTGVLLRNQSHAPAAAGTVGEAGDLRAQLSKMADNWIASVEALLPPKTRGPITGGHIDTDVPPGKQPPPTAPGEVEKAREAFTVAALAHMDERLAMDAKWNGERYECDDFMSLVAGVDLASRAEYEAYRALRAAEHAAAQEGGRRG